MTAPWIAAFACLWFVVLLLGFTVVGVLRRISGVLERVERGISQDIPGAPLLSVVQPFEVIDEAGVAIRSDELIQEPRILLFMERGCEPCRSLAIELGTAGTGNLAVPLLVIAGEDGLGARFPLPPDVPVLRQRKREVAEPFESSVTPHAFVVDHGHVVLDRAVPGSIADLEELGRRQRRARQLEAVPGGS